MYDLSILIPDAGSDDGFYELPYDTAPDIGWAFTFLGYPSKEIKKPNTILLAKKDGKPVAFTYVDKKLKHTVVSYESPSSRSMGFAKSASLWKKPKEFDFKLYLLSKNGPYSHEFVVESLEKAAFELVVDPVILEPAKNMDNAGATSQWLKHYDGGSYQPSPTYYLVRAVSQGLYYHEIAHFFESIKDAYNYGKKNFPSKEYNKILDKHISLIDYLLDRVIAEKFNAER